MEHLILKKLKDFTEEEIKMAALRYANTPYSYTAKKIAFEYDEEGKFLVKPRTIMKMVQKAIKTALVSEETSLKIKKKAINNSWYYGGDFSAIKTEEFYDHLIFQRDEFLKNGGKNAGKTTKVDRPPLPTPEDTLKEIEAALCEINHKIEVFDYPNDDEGVTLEELLSRKEKLEKDIVELKYYNHL